MDISRYIINEFEQPILPKVFSNFLQTFQYEKGKRMPFIAVYHKGISQKTFWYSCVCSGYSQDHDNDDHLDETPASVFNMKAYVATDFSIYDPDSFDFKSKMKIFCSDSKRPSDAFFIDGFVSDPDADILTKVEDFVYYYYHMGIIEKNLHESMDFYEGDDNNYDLDEEDNRPIKIDG